MGVEDVMLPACLMIGRHANIVLANGGRMLFSSSTDWMIGYSLLL